MNTWIRYLPAALCLLAALVLAALGWRWQIMPLVAAAILFAMQAQVRARWVNLTLAGVGLLAAVTGGAAAYLFPPIQLPAPTGPHGVGVRFLTVNTPRPEPFTPDSTDRRVLLVKVWYPAGATEGLRRAPYLDGGSEAVGRIADLAGLPALFISHFADATTHAHLEAPLAQGQFRLLTFSHGYGSWFAQNTSLMQELASHGYVVASVAHAHQTAFAASGPDSLVSYPQIVRLRPSEEDRQDDEEFETALGLRDHAEFTSRLAQQIRQAPSVNHFARLWGLDIRSVIDYLAAESRRPGSPWAGRLDTTRVGCLGMSFGGAASAQAALHDPRVAAALNMDGTQYGDWIFDTLRKPVLFLEGQRSPHGYSMYAPVLGRTTSRAQALLFAGAKHWNFTDVNLYSPFFQWAGVLGEADRHAHLTRMNQITRAFFDAELADTPFSAQAVIDGTHVLAPRQ